jgi:hypothetical protein
MFVFFSIWFCARMYELVNKLDMTVVLLILSNEISVPSVWGKTDHNICLLGLKIAGGTLIIWKFQIHGHSVPC